jgi:hypothetical protein
LGDLESRRLGLHSLDGFTTSKHLKWLYYDEARRRQSQRQTISKFTTTYKKWINKIEKSNILVKILLSRM